MNIRRNIVVLAATTGLVTAGIGLTATAATAAPVTTSAEVGAEVSVDPLAIGLAIDSAISSAQNREGFVRDLSYQAYFNAGGQRLNVVVMNLSQDHDPSGLVGVKGYSTAVYDGITYGVWLFESGTFVNKGDGGWINWAAYGVIQRDGGTMNFSPLT